MPWNKLLLSAGAVFSLAILVHVAFSKDQSVFEYGRSVVLETHLLEEKQKVGELSHEQKSRLAQIYFLTSRCENVRNLHSKPDEEPNDIWCACGGVCKKGSKETKLRKFEKLLAHSKGLKGKTTRAAWQKVSDYPEAKHALLRALERNIKLETYKDRKLRLDLEKFLGSLDIKLK